MSNSSAFPTTVYQMDLTPWTVTSKKRKSTPSASFTGRKRQRHSETPSNDNSRQQTLTQAQWMNTTTSFYTNGDSSPARGARRAMSKKKSRNSTLTQMRFFDDNAITDLEENGSAPEGEIEAIPQVDGPYQSPRKPRKRKTVPTLKHESTESQEYRPPKKSRKSATTGPMGHRSPIPTRQNSTRTIISNAVDDMEYLHRTLNSAPDQGTKKVNTHNNIAGTDVVDLTESPRILPPSQSQPKRKLEIQDSTADTDVFNLTTSSPIRRVTPPRKRPDARSRIPSSQTPDSLPSTASRSTIRKPLRERSCNARAPPSTPRVYQQSPFRNAKSNVPDGPSLRKPDKTKMRSEVDDSQSNLWSIQATSSPSGNTSSQRKEPQSPKEPVTANRLTGQDIEVPSTSQVFPCGELQERTSSAGIRKGSSAVKPSTRASDPLEPTTKPAIAPSSTGPMLVVEGDHNPQPQADIKRYQQGKEMSPTAMLEASVHPASAAPEDDADDSEFGSPIRNDTQFNQEVDQRTSSPAVIEGSGMVIDEASPLASPTPRPARTTATPSMERAESGSSKRSVNLLPPPLPASCHGSRTTRVPLNDIAPSSSPPLPSTKMATQRSVRPASMPHPSQVSTQEATQGNYGSSFMPMETPDAEQRITIKDSSSIRMSMSQIPQEDASQSQLNIDLGLDDLVTNDPDDQYDLNPPSSGAVAATHIQSTVGEKPTRQWMPTESISSPKPTPSPSPRFRQVGDNNAATDPRPVYGDESGEVNDVAEISQGEYGVIPGPVPPNTRASLGNTNVTVRNAPEIAAEPAEDGGIDQRPRVAHEPLDDNGEEANEPPSSPPTASASQTPKSSPPPGLARPLHEYTPLPGYNNETQSNFTQGGHVSAAYVHRQRELGILPKWYVPKCVKVPGYTRR